MQALRGEDVTVYGDGLHTRSFCYVTDLIEGIIRLSRIEEALPVNLGNPEENTVLDCARRVIALTGSASKIRFELLPQDDLAAPAGHYESAATAGMGAGGIAGPGAERDDQLFPGAADGHDCGG